MLRNLCNTIVTNAKPETSVGYLERSKTALESAIEKETEPLDLQRMKECMQFIANGALAYSRVFRLFRVVRDSVHSKTRKTQRSPFFRLIYRLTNALSSTRRRRSTGEMGDFKLAVWKPGSKTADCPAFHDLQGVRREWVVGLVGSGS